MLEYRVYYTTQGIDRAKVLETWLNMLAKEGWRYSGSAGDMIILDREIEPTISVNTTDEIKSVTYSWDLHKEKPSE